MIKITKKLLAKWFVDANLLYFDNKLIEPNKYIISNNRSRYGQFDSCAWSIELSIAWVRSERDYYNTFLHELCHLYVHQNYKTYTQSHGKEWKQIAQIITEKTNGKYGVIQRIGGGQDSSILRNSKCEKYVVFTDYNGNLAMAKYRSDDYVYALKSRGCIKSGTTIYYLKSDDTELDGSFRMRKSKVYALRWQRLMRSLNDVLGRSELINTEIYSNLKKIA